jgi:hypothetical protein
MAIKGMMVSKSRVWIKVRRRLALNPFLLGSAAEGVLERLIA